MDKASDADFSWFALKPTCKSGRELLQKHCGDGATRFEFSAQQLSKDKSGRIARFGSHADADICVPYSHTNLGSFSTTPTGDLLLCDGGKGAVYLFVREKGGLHALDQLKMERGKECLIPMTNGIFSFTVVVAKMAFDLEWRIPLSSQDIQNRRERVRSFYQCRYDLSTQSKMPMPPPWKPENPEFFAIPVCCYKRIAFDGVVAVYVSIDLRTGEKIVVKEVNAGKLCLKVKDTRRDEHRIGVTRMEIEIWATLQHNHVAQLMHHQSWSGEEKRPVQLLMKLYDGDASKLAPRSPIDEPFSTNCTPALPNFLMHCLAALSYMHKKGLVHGNVKLHNILHSREQKQSFPTFYLAGFGAIVGRFEAPMDSYYTTVKDHPPTGCTQVSADIYSFGITILEFLGVITATQLYETSEKWLMKLRVNGYGGKYPRTRENHTASCRVESLRATGLLKNTVLEAMLNPDPAQRPTAAEALEDFSRHYGFKIPADLDY